MAHLRLPGVVLVAVGVAEVDHDAWRQTSRFHLCRGFGDALRRVVHRFSAAAKNDVAIGVSRGHKNSGLAMLGVAQKRV